MWWCLQAKDEIQYAARLAEELMEKHFVKRLLEYSNDAACLRSLGHCIEVLDFCAQQVSLSSLPPSLQAVLLPQLPASNALSSPLKPSALPLQLPPPKHFLFLP